MPQQTDITVKKNDGTTDVVYTAKAPAAGDSSPAIWRNDTVGTAAAHRPELRLSFRNGSDGKSRIGRATYVYNEVAVNTTTGVTTIVEKSSFAVDVRLSTTMVQANIDECVSQFANLLSSTLIKSCLKVGFSAT